MKFKFGVDSFIWAEDFKEKDLWIIEKRNRDLKSWTSQSQIHIHFQRSR